MTISRHDWTVYGGNETQLEAPHAGGPIITGAGGAGGVAWFTIPWYHVFRSLEVCRLGHLTVSHWRPGWRGCEAD